MTSLLIFRVHQVTTQLDGLSFLVISCQCLTETEDSRQGGKMIV